MLNFAFFVLCFGLLQVKRFEYELDEGRKPLFEIVDLIFPRVEELLALILPNHANEQAAKSLCKLADAFYRANQLNLAPAYFNSAKRFTEIMELFRLVLETPPAGKLSEFTQDPETVRENNKSPHWKLRSKIAHFVYRNFQKY